jgi:hypothetical protein
MKKLLILLFVIALVACKPREDGKVVKEERIEITPFKINKIILRDTQLISTMYMESDSGRISISDYAEYFGKEYAYLDYTQFNALRKTVWSLVRNPGSMVYVDPLSNASTPQEVKDRVIRCGMVEEAYFDSLGNEIVQSKFVCDSTSPIRSINMIRFFESWYFDPATNMIERELLGYSVHEYVADKMAFRELFNVFVNNEALEKARKYYFNKFKP